MLKGEKFRKHIQSFAKDYETTTKTHTSLSLYETH
jgi:hypothetical protein